MNYLVPVVEAVVVDCADPVAVAKFWQQLMGGELVWTDEGDVDLQGGPVRLYFQRVAHDTKRSKNRLHLDLRVPHDAYRQAIDRALSLGATLAPDVYDGNLFQVLRDPAGNEFCLIWN